MDKKSLDHERKRLTSIIKQWNESRLDLFAISLPDEKLECHGVMRFYHKDSANNGKYATKCIRVSSNSSTKEVVEMLSTKFRPDMRMLTKPTYIINEVHVDGEAYEMRQLKDKEKPLLVQLSWVKDDREGRFLLHNVDDKAPVRLMDQFVGPNNEDSSFKLTRNLTKKEKKLKKKQEKASKKNNSSSTEDSSNTDARQQEIYTVKHLYSQVPESTFTRTVSNPEAVMKKRREQKLQKRGANILKVYGDSINPEIPYKSLLLLPTDNVSTVIRDALDKYGLGKESPKDYFLIKVVGPPNSKPEEMLNEGWGRETILTDPMCPLDIEQNWRPHEGTLVIQLRHKDIDHSKNSKKSSSPPSSHVSASEKPSESDKKSSKNKEKTQAQQPVTSPSENQVNGEVGNSNDNVPKFLELSTSSSQYKEHVISPNVTEIGSDRRRAAYGPFIELQHRNDIAPSHCVVTNMDGVVTVTPQNSSEVFVDGHSIEETTMLSHESVIRIGRDKNLVYCEPGQKVSMPQIRKKIQAYSQTRNKGLERNQQQRSSQQARAADNRQKSASLPRQLDDQQQYHHPYSSSSRGATSSTSSTQSKQSSVAHQQQQQQHRKNTKNMPPTTHTVRVLPATIQLRNGAEETFLMEVVSATGMNLHFKLSPAYAIYLSLRDIVEVTPKTSLEPVLIEYLCTTTDLLDQTIQLNSKVATELAFWMANASELLNFVRHDQDVSPCTAEAQDTLAKTVQLAFRHLVQCMQKELFQLMPAFLSLSDDDLPGGNESRNKSSDQPTMYNILHMLSSAMSLLRRCRVNAALTIQLFSQLFHFINMWIFNEVATKPERGLCCRSWGIKLRARLARVEAWAEKQGLELAADCHLARVTQAMHLLQAPKQSAEDIAAISGTCFKLNSLQLRALLSQYIPSERDGETLIPNELIDKVVQVARNTADELTRSDGREVQLEEDPDLQLPFLLPEDGYSCDVVQSVPSGLTEFARPLVAESICSYSVNPEATGSWTVYFYGEEHHIVEEKPNGPATPPPSLQPLVLEQPEMATVTFNKRGGGMGLSIVAARGPGQTSLGIYIRSVVKGGAADKDGRLQAGDQLVNVDGHSLVGLTQEKAAEIMTRTGQIVTLTVAKKAALFHGLSPLLDPSPQQERALVTHRRPGGHQQHHPRPKSDGFALHQQGYQQDNEPPYANVETRTHPTKPMSSQQRPASHYPNRRKSPINKSTSQLNAEDVKHPTTRITNSSPRAAASMGNLQHAPEHDQSKSKALADWQKTWEAKRAQTTYQRNRAKSSSALNAATSPDPRNTTGDEQNRRKQVENLITGHVSPRQQEKSKFSPPGKSAAENLSRSRHMGSAQRSIDNPNYELQLPPPPTPPPVSPIAKSPELPTSQKDSPRSYVQPSPKGYRKPDTKSPSPKGSSHTMGRSVERQPEVARVAPTQKTDKSKSSTLPRHFKSGPTWDADSKQKAVQEQLNALRDEEIDELSAKIDSLSALEKNRLNNLLQEREFQRRVEEENRRIFSDEDLSDEGYDVPDRPDRDRLIRMQDDHAEQVDAQRDEEETFRREEERERRRQLERERKEEEEKERQLRERLQRERQFEEQERIREKEEQRRMDEERQKHEEEQRRYEEEMARREEERRQYEEERHRREIEKRQIEEERFRREEEKRLMEGERYRREEEKRQFEEMERREHDRRQHAQEERMRWEREEEEKQRRQRAFEERERMEREERQKERENELERLRSERDAHAKARQDIQRPTDEDEREEAERELLEKQLSQGKPSNFPKFSRPSAYGAASVYGRHTSTSATPYQSVTDRNKPVMRQHVDRGPRPVSDGYFLGKTDHLPDTKNEMPNNSYISASNYNVSATSPTSSHSSRSPNNYVSSHRNPGVIGAQERYRDPRDRREAEIKREQSMKRRQQEPSYLTFKDRQRLFSQGQNSPLEKPKASKKLLEIESNLRKSQMS
uniref:afadin-like isoform X1 n=1 Tax=Styela clava TaxID=7725 RepID=UPI00193A20C2|nr:afadin-like isoform X1 [Styela clava]